MAPFLRDFAIKIEVTILDKHVIESLSFPTRNYLQDQIPYTPEYKVTHYFTNEKIWKILFVLEILNILFSSERWKYK
jgi:thermostable 8-oxoguanine DNA glycosylase